MVVEQPQSTQVEGASIVMQSSEFRLSEQCDFPTQRFGNIWQQLTTERLVTPWFGEA
jgi:hypothetical protein